MYVKALLFFSPCCGFILHFCDGNVKYSSLLKKLWDPLDPAQRKMKLESIEKEGDLETSMIKLTDQVATLNVQRFQNAIEIKVWL